ncbi:MAG: efflux RND transporter permease subunit [Puniceicoccales bacterium]|jgi:cobalt-zinc-cadmium resistance protein CzcA|nr:efflux RND transporter permease subunit [Puniceicoccales bacterium]
MLERIFTFSVQQRAFVLLGVFILVALGVRAASRLPVDAVPDITNVQVQINTAVPALAPEEIETQITAPIEIEMGGIEGLESIRSISKFGLSQVTLNFADGVDIYRARQLAAERLQNVADSLPPGATPKLAPITTGLGEIFHYVVRFAKDAPAAPADAEARLRELKLVQDYIVRPALRTVPGVAEVNTSGGHTKEIIVAPDPAKLAALGVTIGDVARVVAANTSNAGGSVVERGGESVTVRTVARARSAADIANLPLKFAGGGVPLRVGDAASVSVGSAVRTGAATHNGEEAVLGSALMLVGQNSRTVAARCEAKIAELRGKLPAGVEIETVYNRARLVAETIGTVQTNLFEGALLVVAVLAALLGNWRAALIVAAAIPLSLLFALTGMERYGVSGNLMSLGAVDFGLIVDGAVVMAENIVRVLAQRRREAGGRALSRAERDAAIVAACSQVGAPAVFGVAIITIVYVPLFTLTGVEGKTFHPMAFTVVFALAGALLLALTLVPALASFFLGKEKPKKTATVVADADAAVVADADATATFAAEDDNFAMRLAKRAYLPVLGASLRFRWLLCLAALGIFGASLAVFSKLGAEFIPQLDEGDLAAQLIRTTSIGLGDSVALQTATEKLLLEKFPEVSRVFSRVGTSEVATDPMGVNVGDTYILLLPRDGWRKGGDGKPLAKDALTALMAETLATHFPGQSASFSQPIELRFNELLSGSRADLAIKVFGDDYDTLERLAGEVRELVEKIPGAADVEFDAAGKAPVLQIEVNRDAMLRYNVTAEEVNATVGAAFAGEQGGVIIEGERRFPIVTRLAETARRDFPEGVKRLPVRTSDGGLVALGQVAVVRVGESVNTITREAFRRRMAVQVNLRGRDVESFVNEAQALLAASVKLPEGYRIEYGGAFENLRLARERLVLVVPMALGLIFLLLYLAFGRMRQALVVYTGIPLAVTGGVFALWARGLPFSISAGVGFIALSGVAVLNGVVLVSFINELRGRGRGVREAVFEGALTRLRPVLTTALVASLGFLPMALATGAGAEVQRPLATVVIGGILSATFLTLLLVPSLYALVEKEKRS